MSSRSAGNLIPWSESQRSCIYCNTTSTSRLPTFSTNRTPKLDVGCAFDHMDLIQRQIAWANFFRGSFVCRNLKFIKRNSCESVASNHLMQISHCSFRRYKIYQRLSLPPSPPSPLVHAIGRNHQYESSLRQRDVGVSRLDAYSVGKVHKCTHSRSTSHGKQHWQSPSSMSTYAPQTQRLTAWKTYLRFAKAILYV